ncbi:hypothetical protein SCHAM137S_02343 [Streptomyces chartreusis]
MRGPTGPHLRADRRQPGGHAPAPVVSRCRSDRDARVRTAAAKAARTPRSRRIAPRSPSRDNSVVHASTAQACGTVCPPVRPGRHGHRRAPRPRPGRDDGSRPCRRRAAGGREPHPVPLGHHGHQLARSALGDEAAPVDDAHTVAEPLGLFHAVGGVEDCHALLAEPGDALQDRVPALRIDTDGGLVQHQQRRRMHQSGPDVETSAHATRQGVDAIAGPGAEVDEVQHLVDAAFQPAAGQPVEAAEEAEVLADAQVGVEGHVLRDEADELLGRTGGCAHRSACHVHGPGVGAQETAHHPDRRRLARPVRPEQAVRLARGDAQAHVVDGGTFAEPPDQVGAFEDEPSGVRVSHGSVHDLTSMGRAPRGAFRARARSSSPPPV